MTLGGKIRQLRTETDLSQGQLARRVGTDGRQISRYENGHVTPSLDALIKLSEVFDVSIDYLVFDTAPRRPRHLDDESFREHLDGAMSFPAEDKAWLVEAMKTLRVKNEVKNLAESVD